MGCRNFTHLKPADTHRLEMSRLVRTRWSVLPNSHTSAVSNDIVNVGLACHTIIGTGNSVPSSGRESHRGPTQSPPTPMAQEDS